MEIEEKGSLMGWQICSSHDYARHCRVIRVYGFLVMRSI